MIKSKLFISIFIPAYNAENFIESVINRIPKDTWSYIKNIWVINDGSEDKTENVVLKLAESENKIRLISLSSNKGYGTAVSTGLKKCQNDGCDFAICLHADGQYPPESIPEFVSYMADKKIDICQGSRIASGTALKGGMPFYKLVAGKVLTFFENRVFGLNLTDYHSGFLVYSKKAINNIPFEALSGSFDFDVEIIACARSNNITISELPIPTRYANETSYLNPVTYGLRVVGVMIKYSLGVYGRCR